MKRNVLVEFVDRKLEYSIILGVISEFDKDKISIDSTIIINKDSGIKRNNKLKLKSIRVCSMDLRKNELIQDIFTIIFHND
ncbi:hypothetical protein [Candidatus Borreliella tachyglossi]|uniref:hypothetical protein n=1 Tax=Candidatus Borreliella tachyglossi TaxID=1964448 RepID=UPI004042AFE0